jgi:hypothetical protein
MCGAAAQRRVERREDAEAAGAGLTLRVIRSSGDPVNSGHTVSLIVCS